MLIGNTATGIDAAILAQAVAGGCNRIAVVGNGSYHDSCHFLYAWKSGVGTPDLAGHAAAIIKDRRETDARNRRLAYQYQEEGRGI